MTWTVHHEYAELFRDQPERPIGWVLVDEAGNRYLTEAQAVWITLEEADASEMAWRLNGPGSLIPALHRARVLDVERVPNGLQISESCDGYFHLDLTPAMVEGLISELRAMLETEAPDGRS